MFWSIAIQWPHQDNYQVLWAGRNVKCGPCSRRSSGLRDGRSGAKSRCCPRARCETVGAVFHISNREQVGSLTGGAARIQPDKMTQGKHPALAWHRAGVMCMPGSELAEKTWDVVLGTKPLYKRAGTGEPCWAAQRWLCARGVRNFWSGWACKKDRIFSWREIVFYWWKEIESEGGKNTKQTNKKNSVRTEASFGRVPAKMFPFSWWPESIVFMWVMWTWA